MAYDIIELSDLEKGIQREFSITPSFLRFVLSRKMAGDQQTLDECLRVAADMTAVTNREMAFIIHSQLPKNPEDYNRIIKHFLVNKLAVPNIGDTTSVPNPKLDRIVYHSFVNKMSWGSKVRHPVYVPIVHLHTHPGSLSHKGTFPSKPDLANAKERYNSTIDIAGEHIRIINPELQVITRSSGLSFVGDISVSSQLFYQLTEDEEAFEKFMSRYDALMSDCSNDPKKFARKMQRSGAFKTAYFEPGELVEPFENGQGIRISKKNETKLAKKFAYTLKVIRSLW